MVHGRLRRLMEYFAAPRNLPWLMDDCSGLWNLAWLMEGYVGSWKISWRHATFHGSWVPERPGSESRDSSSQKNQSEVSRPAGMPALPAGPSRQASSRTEGCGLPGQSRNNPGDGTEAGWRSRDRGSPDTDLRRGRSQSDRDRALKVRPCSKTVATSCPAARRRAAPRSPRFSSSFSLTRLSRGGSRRIVPGHLRAVGDAGEHVRLFELGVVFQDLPDRGAGGEEIQNQGDPDSMPPDAGLPEQMFGLMEILWSSSSRVMVTPPSPLAYSTSTHPPTGSNVFF